MAKRLSINKCNLNDVKIEHLDKIVNPWELGVLLTLESYSQKTDELLDNLLDYYLKEEKYDYCCIIRDEINKRLL